MDQTMLLLRFQTGINRPGSLQYKKILHRLLLMQLDYESVGAGSCHSVTRRC